MGKEFGELSKVRGMVYFKLSPFEQRAFPNAITGGIPNLFRRIRSNIFRVAPPFIIGFLVHDYVEKKHAQMLRKNPADYENDE